MSIEINENNFDNYFFDARRHRPKKGQVMVKYEAMADLIDGQMKRDLIDLLLYSPKGHESAPKVLKVLGGAVYEDSVKISLEMARDLAAGKSIAEVAEKPYRYKMEFFFYTDRQYADEITNVGAPHWSKIGLIDAEQYSKNVELLENMEFKESDLVIEENK